MKIGIIGGGAIAKFLLEKDVNIRSLLVRRKEKYRALANQYDIDLYTNIDEFLSSKIDLVVEAADVRAVKQYLPHILQKKDVIIISIGAFSDDSFYQHCLETAEKYNHKIYLPSGAIGGLDLLQNAEALGGVKEVLLTTRKPASALVEENLTKERVIFSGSAREAIQRFPKNINVAIVLSLAGIGSTKTKVQIIADPKGTKNEHIISIKGDFGTATMTIYYK